MRNLSQALPQGGLRDPLGVEADGFEKGQEPRHPAGQGLYERLVPGEGLIFEPSREICIGGLSGSGAPG